MDRVNRVLDRAITAIVLGIFLHELPRIHIPRTPVNKGIKGAGAAKSPGPGGGCSGVTRPQPSAPRTSLGCLTTGDARLDALVYEVL
jgi:hypothetical protein